MTAALVFAAMLCMADAPAKSVALEFKDAATYENRPVLQYRAIDFRDWPTRPLGKRKFGPGARYGVVPVGSQPETALTIVWLPKAAGGPELWLDANGDGRLADDERHVMSGRELAIPATIALEPKPEAKKVARTLFFRRSAVGDGLRYTVRGYAQGRLQLGQKSYAVLLIDGNANARFDSVGQDRVWIDLNEDGHFDGLTEQFPLGKPITLGKDVYVIRSDATASAVVANLRSAGQGKLRLTLGKGSSRSATIAAEMVSDLGELVVVDKLDQAVPVPFGEYRLSNVKLEIPVADGKSWTYNFDSQTSKNYSVPTGGETTVALLRQLAMQVTIDLRGGKAAPGETLSIQPKLTADRSLYLSSCRIGKGDEFQRAEGNAEIVLLAPDGKVVNRGLSGFS